MTDEKAFPTAPAREPHDRLRSFAYRAALDVYTRLGTRWAPQRSPYMPGLPVRVEGFHEEILGIGETARQFHRALMDAGHPVERLALDRRLRPVASPGTADEHPVLRLSHLNPDQLLEHSMRLASAADRRQPHVGYWVWELPRAPQRWRAAARLVDRVWAPSRFAADAIAAALPASARVDVLPPPVLAQAPPASPPPVALDDDRVHTLAVCDLRSSAARKNPTGALDAFDRARNQAPARLVLKITAGEACPDALAALTARIGTRDDVRLITEPLSDAGMQALIAACDIALCLHRSEGFGLLAAHAASHGKPVIATNWSAPTEFLTPDGAALVDYRLVPVADPQGIYPPGQMWAEPELDHAADWLTRLIDDAELRARMGATAARETRAQLGPDAWYGRFSALLETLA